MGSNPTTRAKKIKVAKVKEYLLETYNEMVHKVTWPKWKELRSNTILVVIASVFISLFIFAMDFVFGIQGDADSFWKGVLGIIYGMF